MERDPDEAVVVVISRRASLLGLLGIALATGCKSAPSRATDAPAAKGDLGTPADAAIAVTFSVEERTRLIATLGSHRVVVFDLPKQAPPERFGDTQESLGLFESAAIDATGAFEHDGIDEAVVSLFMRGNACPGPAYVLVRPAGDRVAISSTFGGCSGILHVVPGKDTDAFVVDGIDATQTFRPSAGSAVLFRTEAVTAHETKNVITYADAEAHGGNRSLSVDLDGDGKPETIDCTALRDLTCTIAGGDGADWGTVVAPQRLGVLNTVTKRHRDLVVGPGTLLRWSGREYD